MASPILKPPAVEPIPRLALRAEEAALALGICDKTLRKWVAEGDVPHYRRNGVLLFSVAALQAWLLERCAAATTRSTATVLQQ